MYDTDDIAYDIEARHMIEALRSGVPSRAVGQYFSEARPKDHEGNIRPARSGVRAGEVERHGDLR